MRLLEGGINNLNSLGAGIRPENAGKLMVLKLGAYVGHPTEPYLGATTFP